MLSQAYTCEYIAGLRSESQAKWYKSNKNKPTIKVSSTSICINTLTDIDDIYIHVIKYAMKLCLAFATWCSLFCAVRLNSATELFIHYKGGQTCRSKHIICPQGDKKSSFTGRLRWEKVEQIVFIFLAGSSRNHLITDLSFSFYSQTDWNFSYWTTFSVGKYLCVQHAYFNYHQSKIMQRLLEWMRVLFFLNTPIYNS